MANDHQAAVSEASRGNYSNLIGLDENTETHVQSVLNINAEIKALKQQSKLVPASNDSRLSHDNITTVTNVLTWLNSGLSDRCDYVTLYKCCAVFVD